MLRWVFAALILIVSQSASPAQAGALTFSATSQQYVTVPNFHTLGVTTEVTVEFWAKFTTTAAQAAFGLDPDLSTNRCLAHLNDSDTNIYWDFGDISNGGRVSTPNTAGPTAGWTHYAFVASQSGNFMKIYINGTEVASAASFNAFETAVASALRIGGGGADYFTGSIDEFRVWNVARTPTQIAASRTSPVAGNATGLRLYFKFDEVSGNTAVNSATSTGAARKGTLVNAPTRISLAPTTLTVTSTADSGAGSLRQAVLDVSPTGDTIVFDPTVFATAQTITLTSGQILLHKNLTIDGSALPSQVAISGGNALRLFTIRSGQTVALKSLMLTGGYGLPGDGSFTDIYRQGGAIFFDGMLFGGGTLALTQCTFSGNSGNYGGAIYNGFGALTLTQCTLSGNSGGSGGGGAISNYNGTLTLTHCTLTGNSAGFGGAIESGGGLALTHCTLSDNHANGATFGGGGIDVLNGNGVTLTNTIISGNTAATGTGPDFYQEGGALTASGCLIGNPADSGISNGVNGNITGVNALLTPLGNYGGPTQTMPPQPGSPAINPAGGAATSPFTTDQRGFPRIAGAPVDIGAVEVQMALTVTTNLDDGSIGSLRQAVLRAVAGATITFAPDLNGGTLTLGAGEIVLDRDVTIDASGLSSGVTISGGGATRIFTVSSGQTVALKGLTLTGGNGAGAAASGNGGAIYKHSGSALTLARCTLSGNSGSNGGAIYEVLGGTLALTGCTLSGNTAGNNGGAILHSTGTLALTHCTLSGNSASAHGGGIYNGSTLTLTNSIVAGSTASPDDIYNPLYSTVTRVGANIVQSLYNDGGTVNGSGTISTAAPLLAPLGHYGGPTQTMPPLPGSPAIDGVPAGSEVAGLTTDQRGTGFARVVDADGNGSALADIGAVEVRRVLVTTTGDELDTPTGAQTSLREAIRDNTTADAIGFAPGLNGGTISLDAAKGEIVIGNSMTIDASGLSSGVTIDGGPGTNRIFFVNSGQTVVLQGLTLTGGGGTGAVGSGYGGAILNNGALTLTQCTLSGNSATYGGAIVNDLVTNTTLTLTQCTLSGNAADYGGAILNYRPLTLTHCSLSGNLAGTNGGAIHNAVNTLTLTNSIVTGSIGSPEDLYNSLNATLTRVGANIVQSFTDAGTSNGSGIISNAAPLLAPLGNYGGPTLTMALLPGSPARNAAAVLVPALTTDQRGFPILGTPDIGAYEAGTFTNYNAWIYEMLPAAATGLQHASTADYDGDGVTNSNEWPARTDPADRASYFHITHTTRTGNTTSGAIGIDFPSVIGRSYIVEYSTDLISWTPSGTPIPGTGNLLTLVLNYDGYSKLFVRARVGP